MTLHLTGDAAITKFNPSFNFRRLSLRLFKDLRIGNTFIYCEGSFQKSKNWHYIRSLVGVSGSFELGGLEKSAIHSFPNLATHLSIAMGTGLSESLIGSTFKHWLEEVALSIWSNIQHHSAHQMDVMMVPTSRKQNCIDI